MSYDLDRMRTMARKTPVYIDVLHVPDISDAVQQAATQLRQGILMAMSSNVDADPPSASALSPTSQLSQQSKMSTVNNESNPNSSNSESAFSAAASSLSASSHVAKRPRKQVLSLNDPYDVYSAAITAKSNRSSSQSRRPASDSNADGTSVEEPKSSLLASSSNSTRIWDREKKAGPSILTKRARSESVFQPGPKRERRNPETDASSKNKPANGSASKTAVQCTTPSAENIKSSQPRTKVKPKAKDLGTKPLPAAKTHVHTDAEKWTKVKLTPQNTKIPSTIKKPQTYKKSPAPVTAPIESPATAGKPPILSKSSNSSKIGASSSRSTSNPRQAAAAKGPSGTAITSKNTIASNNAKPPTSMAIVRAAANAALLRNQPRKPIPRNTAIGKGGGADSIDTAEGALAAMAAATAKKGTSRRGTISGGNSLTALGQGGMGSGGGILNGLGTSSSSSASLTFLRKRMGADAGRGKAGLGANGCSKITAAQQEAFARRGGINALGIGGMSAGMNAGGGASTKGGHPSATPNTKSTTSGKAKTNAASSNVVLDIQLIPGSQPIEGVQPNGYTVSERGVVSPVVTFTQRPKVPHKMRQTVLDKVFSAWKDERQVPEATALQKSLRTEQEIYARSAGHVEYRAAMLAKLKEIRSGGG